MTEAKKTKVKIEGKDAEVIIDVKPTGYESALFNLPLDLSIAGVKKYSQEVVSLYQNAQMRIQGGKDSNVSKSYNLTREGVIWMPNSKPMLVRDSPLLYIAKEAVIASRENREVYPTLSQIEAALANSTEYPQKDTRIPTHGFNSDALTVFAFGGEENAKKYGEFLKDAGVESILVRTARKSYVDGQRKPFVTQVSLGSVEGHSNIEGVNRSFYLNNWLRGAREIK